MTDEEKRAARSKQRKPATDRKRRFAEEYIVDLNATKAAERAGYSKKTARSQGQRLLTDVDIAAMIAEMQQVRSQSTGVTAARVLEELALIAFADIGEAVRVSDDGDVNVRNLDQLDPRVRRAIGEINQTVMESVGRDGDRRIEKTKTGIKHHSKVAALKMLMDHLGMSAPTTTKTELTGADGKPIETRTELRAGRGLSREVAREMAIKVLGIPEHLLAKAPAAPTPQEPSGGA